ncbi:TonB-linked SusC/RagA family outer membrane protein [Mucilaginibacter frigoritolerans]|uniref:TonB-linked SusC/RagA family outer membrane protein n=1 Tax=Mucilaginibacter frigoritolerans TaxID=652788 RepID=A0A562TWX9_9SPHI|nr:SusC/RagA family TonB-linked outer membrane protein [Mucilaginibacter frigoritolerans]TWI97614.1 TonB-linked SusC/RagA family outer membrane protein [Mucilaginibacter frigoritolerans]
MYLNDLPKESKKTDSDCRGLKKGLKKWIVLLFFLQVGFTAFAQKVNISAHNMPFDKFVSLVKSQTGYSFFYNHDWLKQARPVTLNAKDMLLDDVLRACFENEPFSYAIVNKTIVLKLKSATDNQKYPVNRQRDHVTGRVYDTTGAPIQGANVEALGSVTYHTTTNAKGDFEFPDLTKGDSIIVSYVGYRKELLIYAGAPSVTITLHHSHSVLDAVVVQAYGTTTRRDNIGSISTVTAAQIEKQPVINVVDALEGQVPGLNITPTGGAPGSRTLVQIRGQNSLASATDPQTVLSTYDQPLFIVDGVPMPLQNQALIGGSFANAQFTGPLAQQVGLSSLNGINPHDIESISVLKDADATSIYGSQGSNGVVIITTKRAKAGADALSVAYNQGITEATRTTPMMNIQQYLQMRNEALTNDQLTPSTSLDPDLLLFDQNKNTNWVKDFFGGTAKYTDLHLSQSGGNEYNNYLISGGYTRSTYDFPGDMSDNRYTFHSSFTHTSENKKFKLDFGTDYSYDSNDNSGEPAALAGFTLPPNFPNLLDANGNPVWSYKGYSYNNLQGNPLAYLKTAGSNGTYNLNTHILASYNFLSNLSVSLNAGYGRATQDFTSEQPIASQNPQYGPTGSSTFSFGNTDVINIIPQLNYYKQIGKGKLSVLIGGTYKKNYGTQYTILGFGYTSDQLLNSTSGASSYQITNTASYYKYVDGFTRINYNWDGKYIINLTGNHDGSSNFGPDKRYGSFGSAGVGWILSEENWVKNNLTFLSFAKLAVNYGTSGSDGVQPYQYQPNWQVSGSFPYQGFTGYTPITPLNPVYAWALNKKFNEQIDLGFFQNKLLVNFNVYQNLETNQLVSYLEPIQTGFSGITENAPYQVENRGWELAISSGNIKFGAFSWTGSFNMAHNSNVLKSFPGIQNTPYASLYVVGKPLSDIQVIPYEGVNPQTGLFQFKAANGTITSSPNLYSGFNSVGGDETQLVDINPKLQGGFGNTLNYKRWSLYLFFNFSVQKGANYLYNIYANGASDIPGSPLVNEPAILFGKEWKQPGDQATIQRFADGFNGSNAFNIYNAASAFSSSTGAYSDASYIRLKTASLSYRLPDSWAKKMALKSCSFYVSGQNLFLITGYQLGDPESLSLFSLPPQRTIVAGINANL